MVDIVGVNIDDVIEYHAGTPNGNYDTLCGLDADDPQLGHFGRVPAPKRQRITCEQCKTIWFGTMELKLKPADFE